MYRRKAKSLVDNFPDKAKAYILALFPIIAWLPRYNTTWLSGDLIAGLTIGCVVVPQGMAYAKVFTLVKLDKGGDEQGC